jgi:apolipoprotein D and lipocalin family protein
MELTHAPPWLRWFPGAWSDHHVIYVDAEHSCMLVGTPDRDGLWLMARDPWLPDAARDALVSLAAKLGFPVTRLRMTPQSSSPSEAAEATPTPSAKAA